MASNGERVAKNTIYLYMRTGVTMLVSLYTSRIVLNALGVEDFGIWGVLGGLVSMFGFINSSLSSSVFRYLTHAIGTSDKRQINDNYSVSIVIHLVLAIVIFLLCESIGQWFLQTKLVVPVAKQAMANAVFHIVIATSCISLLSVPFNSVIIAYERMNVFAYMAIVDVVIKLAIAYLIDLLPNNKLYWYAIMMLSVCVLMLFFYFLYVKLNFKTLRVNLRVDRKTYFAILGFSGWSLFGNLAYIGYTQGLNMLINMFFGPIANAARAISLQIEQSIRTFVTNFQTAINPQIIKKFASGEMDRMHALIFTSSKFSVYLLLFLALPVVLETDFILDIWLKQVPAHTTAFCRIMFMVITLETLSNAIGIGVVATGEIKKYHVIVGLILLSIVPISYFILCMGAVVESVFVVYFVVEIIAVVARLMVANKQIYLPVGAFFRDVICKFLLVLCLSAAMPLLSVYMMRPGFERFIVVILLSMLSTCITIYHVGLTNVEREMLRAMIIRKIAR